MKDLIMLSLSIRIQNQKILPTILISVEYKNIFTDIISLHFVNFLTS